MAKIFKVPFAATGDKTAVPDAVQSDGSVSYAQGYGFDYERPTDGTDPLAKVFPRRQYNAVLNDVTGAIGEIQQNGAAEWQAAGAPYPLNARVRYGTNNYISAIANNNSGPGANSDWINESSLSTGRLISVRSFTTPGTSTYIPTAGTRFVTVEVIGSGGGSGSVPATGAGSAVSGGGGGGGYSYSLLASGFSGAAITIGVGGQGASIGANDAQQGGLTSFGSTLSATGGFGGQSIPAAIPLSDSILIPAGSGGGGSGGNIFNVEGGFGSPGIQIQTSISAGRGGIAGKGYKGGGDGRQTGPGNAALAGLPGQQGRVIISEWT